MNNTDTTKMDAVQEINQSSWIWVPHYHDTESEAKFVLFRKTFNLDAVPSEKQQVCISADTRYRLLVNEQRASFGPCKSYLSRWNFEEVDIRPFLRPGRNVLAVRVLRFSPAHIGNSSFIRGNIPGLIVQGTISVSHKMDSCRCYQLTRQKGISLNSDESWRATEDRSLGIIPRSEWNYALGPPLLSLNEQGDQRLAETDWASPDFNDSHWSSATIVSGRSMMMPVLEPRKLAPRTIPMLPENERVFEKTVKCSGSVLREDWDRLLKCQSNVTIARGSTEIVEIQTEVLTTGFLNLSCSGSAGSKITIMCAESYEREHAPAGPGGIGTERHKGDRTDSTNGVLYGLVDEYTLADGDNILEPFWFRCFRYIRLTITARSEPVIIKAFTFRETHYPLSTTTQLHRSSGLDELWKISLNTIRNCMHETFEDCPFYEQNQFAMDTRIQILFVYQLSRDDRLARKTIHEFYASRREDGLVETHFPVPFRAVNIPQFSLYWVLMVCDHYEYFADKNFIRQYLGTIDGVLNHFIARIGAKGMAGCFDGEAWPFVDWVKEWHGKGGLQTMAIPPAYHQGDGIVAYNSLILTLALQNAANLNTALGRDCIAREYRQQSQTLLDAVNDECWKSREGFYSDGPSTPHAFCQHTQVFAILAGAIQGDDAARLMRRTLDTPNLPKCSYAMSFYVLRAASKAGIYDEYFDRLMSPWRRMAQDNLTTWAEDDVMYRSDCHGWSSSPVYETVREIFGLSTSSAQGGWGKVKIAPRFGLQQAASGTFIVGKDGDEDVTVDVEWNEEMRLLLSASKEVETEVVLKNGRSEKVVLGARPWIAEL